MSGLVVRIELVPDKERQPGGDTFTVILSTGEVLATSSDVPAGSEVVPRVEPAEFARRIAARRRVPFEAPDKWMMFACARGRCWVGWDARVCEGHGCRDCQQCLFDAADVTTRNNRVRTGGRVAA